MGARGVKKGGERRKKVAGEGEMEGCKEKKRQNFLRKTLFLKKMKNFLKKVLTTYNIGGKV